MTPNAEKPRASQLMLIMLVVEQQTSLIPLGLAYLTLQSFLRITLVLKYLPT
jgi:hypothetical protein